MRTTTKTKTLGSRFGALLAALTMLLAAAGGAAQAETLELRFQSEHPNVVEFALYSQHRQGHSWPAPGRVYVLDRGQAGAFIGRGGWIDQPVQIVGLGMDRDEEIQDGAKPVMSREETRARLDALMRKASLTRGEQLFVLKAMNDGVEI